MLIFKRGLGKNNAEVNSVSAYTFYKYKHPESEITREQYINITVAFNEFTILNLIQQGTEFYMPFGLGSLSIRKYDSSPRLAKDGKTILVNQIPVDYVATKALWEKDSVAREQKKLIRVTNEHTNWFRFRFFWDKRTCKLANLTCYSFIPLRKYSRLLASVLKDENAQVDFYLDNTKITHPC